MLEKIIEPAGFMIIRDQLYSVVFSEIENQKSMATGDYLTMLNSFYNENGNLSIFQERSEPFDVQELNAINIWITNVDENEGSNSRLQKGKVSFNIDIATFSQNNYTESVKYLHWMAAVIRGFLMTDEYLRLGFSDKSFISRRWVPGINIYQPNDPNNTDYLCGGSVSFIVEYDEKNLEKDSSLFDGNHSWITAGDYGEFKLEKI